MVVSGETLASPQNSPQPSNPEQAMGCLLGRPTSLHEDIEEGVNFGHTPSGSKYILTYRLPADTSRCNFGFVDVGNGHQARMRATTGDGRTCGHDSPRPIPDEVYRKISCVSKETSANSYKVTLKSGGENLDEYFG